MISKSSIKLIQSLKLKKFRQKYDLFVAEGSKTVLTILKAGLYEVEMVYCTEEVHGLIKTFYADAKTVERSNIDKASLLKSGSNVIALFKISSRKIESLDAYQKVIYLDDVQDPGNVGAIIRIADWYGIDAVIRSEGSADFYSPKVIQSTMGSLVGTALGSLSQEEILNLKYYMVTAGLDSVDQPISTIDRSVCLVIGNEGNGASSLLLDAADQIVTIEGVSKRNAESLNASVATGILCDRLFSLQPNTSE